MHYRVARCSAVRVDAVEGCYLVGYAVEILHAADRSIVDVGDDETWLNASSLQKTALLDICNLHTTANFKLLAEGG